MVGLFAGASAGHAATEDGGSAPALGATAERRAADVGTESSWCPVFRAELRSAEEFKAQNAGHPRMGEIDQKISMARTALEACLKQARDVAEHGTPAQRYANQVRREVREREEKEAADQREAEVRAKDPAFTRVRLSALLCYVASSRQHAKEIIDDQRRGARSGLGVIDKEQVYEYQGELVIMSKLERLVKADLKAHKSSPLPCKPAAGKDFADCIHAIRMAPSSVDPGENEYTAEATLISESSETCTPWKRLTPETPVSPSVTSTPK